MIEIENSTKPYASAHGPVPIGLGDRKWNHILEALMVSLVMIVFDVLAHDLSKMALSERHDAAKALGLDGSHEALGVGVQIWTPRRQPQEFTPVDFRMLLKCSV